MSEKVKANIELALLLTGVVGFLGGLIIGTPGALVAAVVLYPVGLLGIGWRVYWRSRH